MSRRPYPEKAPALTALDDLSQRVNDDPDLRRRGRHVTARMLLDLRDVGYIVAISAGSVTAIEPATTVMARWTFALRADRREWNGLWAEQPAPGSHDILALLRRTVMTAEGDLHPFMANLAYFKELIGRLGREGAQTL